MSKIRDTQQHPNVEIAVRNFGPIAEATIDLRPLRKALRDTFDLSCNAVFL